MGPECGIGEQQDHVGVVMREAAVLGELRLAAGIGNAYVRRDDDVRSTRVPTWPESRGVVVEGYGWTVEDLAEADGCSVLLKRLDSAVNVRARLEPEQEPRLLYSASKTAGLLC